MKYLTKVATIPDLFGGHKHTFKSDKYNAWIVHTIEDKCIVSIFCIDEGIMLVPESNEGFKHYNLAYMWLLTKIELLKSLELYQ